MQWAHIVKEPFTVEAGLMTPLIEDPSKFVLDRKVTRSCVRFYVIN